MEIDSNYRIVTFLPIPTTSVIFHDNKTYFLMYFTEATMIMIEGGVIIGRMFALDPTKENLEGRNTMIKGHDLERNLGTFINPVFCF